LGGKRGREGGGGGGVHMFIMGEGLRGGKSAPNDHAFIWRYFWGGS